MVMGGNGGDATAWGGGFAARASRRETDEGPALEASEEAERDT